MSYLIVIGCIAAVALVAYGLWDTYDRGFRYGYEEGLLQPCRLDQLDPDQWYRVIAVCPYCKGFLQSEKGAFFHCELVGGAGSFRADQLPQVGWKVRLHQEHEMGLWSLKRVED